MHHIITRFNNAQFNPLLFFGSQQLSSSQQSHRHHHFLLPSITLTTLNSSSPAPYYRHPLSIPNHHCHIITFITCHASNSAKRCTIKSLKSTSLSFLALHSKKNVWNLSRHLSEKKLHKEQWAKRRPTVMWFLSWAALLSSLPTQTCIPLQFFCPILLAHDYIKWQLFTAKRTIRYKIR